jgi:ABC-2 type transport system ATP-binding protein
MTEAGRQGVPSPPSDEPDIRIHELTKKFPGTLALDAVSFDVPRNAVFGLLGPNGAGKTTLFSLVAGFLKPTSGHIKVLGVDVEDVSALHGRLSILPQDAFFQANVPILEQLTFFAELNGFSRDRARERALRSLAIVGLEEKARANPRVLSHGMSKRLGIAQAFLGDPAVVILDEPTAGLDPDNAHSIRQLVRRLRHSGTVVISSHDLREIQEICTHVAIIDRGKVVCCGDMESLTRATRQLRMTFWREMAGEERERVRVPGLLAITQDPEAQAPGVNSYMFHLDLEGVKRSQEQVTGDLLRKLIELDLTPRTLNEGASLEEVYRRVTGGRANAGSPHEREAGGPAR